MRHILLAVLLFLAVLILASVPRAHARDPDGRYASSPLKPWFDGLTSRNGNCCSASDGQVIADADWDSKDGHYRVRIDGEWVDVPDEAVLKQPNLDGRTLLWPMFKDGKMVPRCFIAGSGT
jgi:hypothetical protein